MGSPVIGKTLGQYRILEQVGAGGMGIVYRARDERLERDVAIKILTHGLLATDAARRRFRREALALSKLTHPNIATIHDFDTHEGINFLVMEYIPGVSMSDKIASGPLPEPEFLHLGVQLASALGVAHEHGVVHRDLKPANLRVTPEGWLKVLDFGLARPLLLESETTTDTAGERLAGTPPYMAPEQLRGEPAGRGPAAVPGRERRAADQRDPARLATATFLAQPAPFASARRNHPQSARQGPGPALPVGARAGRRSRAARCAHRDGHGRRAEAPPLAPAQRPDHGRGGGFRARLELGGL